MSLSYPKVHFLYSELLYIGSVINGNHNVWLGFHGYLTIFYFDTWFMGRELIHGRFPFFYFTTPYFRLPV